VVAASDRLASPPLSWEAADGAARRRIGDLIAPPLYRFVLGPTRHRRRAALASLIETERWPLEKLRERQEQLLRRLLTQAARTSSWYRKRLPEAPDLARFSLDDLHRLPVLEKADLQDHLDEITGSGRFASGVGENQSSGSTGTPVRVYQSREYFVWHAAETVRGLQMCGPFRPGMARAVFWGNALHSREHRGLVGNLHDASVNILWFDAFSLRRDTMPATIRRLRAYRPAFIVGYMSIVMEIARELDRPPDGLLGVQTTAETLTPQDRLAIETSFGAPVFNRYGSNEVGTIAQECALHDGLHMVMENNLVEIVGADDRPLTTPGSEGDVVITNLRNFATPLIRYRLGDVGRLGGDGCLCGRGSARLESVIGRTSDVIVSPRGALLHSLFFLKLFYGRPVLQFRVDQETPERLRLRVVPGARYSDEVRQRVTSQILTHGDPRFDVLWEVVDEIPRSPSGKFRVTVNHVPRTKVMSADPIRPARGGQGDPADDTGRYVVPGGVERERDAEYP
jgi:phenylacetate-CoA ligase